MTTRNLFIITFIAIIGVYLYVFGEIKTIEMLKEEYLFLLALVPLLLVFVFFKVKLKNYELIDFNKNSNLSLKTTIIFFLVFQVIDYVSYDGFIGMISQWILYWIMGLIALLVIENINFYRNYKLANNKS
ncbi:hypothetical protein [Arcobacter roscoffensis]|uniref:Uncharacterized protein n=1 Tax=Arcobacter roscoffensis TaxID=2961520 RepID=A0ABY5E1C6_9BACT|nr:hypothetical protein [Arcobacter roscoffensis]UTJ05526.1 hypothetical protein NJU99_09640 [Arcobacter roscoffensis]